MHSRVTCQIHGFDYSMFEQIRNYRADTADETDVNLKKALDEWKQTSELEYSVAYYNKQYSKNYDFNEATTDTLIDLAKFFELLRKKTKAVVFGTVYGITDIGLADQIQGTKEEAQALINGFKAGLPNYLKWEAETHKEMLRHGYVETVLGRKRRFGETIAEAQSTDLWRQRGWHYLIERCKRQATNVKVQGSSADQVKKAMVELHYPKRPDGTICTDRREWLEKGYQSLLEKYDVKILLQVHDELVFDVPQDIEWFKLEEIAEVMQNVVPTAHLGVEFASDIEASPYWGGNFSPEEIKQINAGELNWREVFRKEVNEKMEKELGREYEIGLFAERDDDEDAA